MKKLFAFSFLILLFTSFTFIRKGKFIPPGTVQITETFFADEAEITNFAWWEYETWIKNKYGPDSPEHIAALPDTNVWLDKKAYNAPYVTYYYRHPAYRDYPVVGISYEQAVAFCKWRTERVKELWSIRTKSAVNFEYRLPTKEEWEFLSGSGTLTIFANKGKDPEKKTALANFIYEDADTLETAGVIRENADVTAPVFSYQKNSFGIFNCIGNVAEMVSAKGICKGGSWRHRLEQCRVGTDILYTEPSAWLGFRCVAVLSANAN